jgi:tetratricopeptide (TPR) repeat protein
MFGWFESESPLTAEQRRWIEERFTWLRKEFGEERLRGVVVTPTEQFFPDRYAPTAEGAATLLDRLCSYMGVERARIDLELYTSPSADDVATAFNPMLRREYALGAFQEERGRIVMWLERSRLCEPHSVVSTLAHELGHVHLLADGRCDPNTPDHEPLTDLLAVYFGLGVFVANNAIREVNWRSGNWEGWSMARQGYLSIAEYAYALALYARSRGEHRPRWAKFLRPDVRGLFKTESKHLAAGGSPSGSGHSGPTTTMIDRAATCEQPHTAEVPDIDHHDPESGVDVDDQTEAEDSSATAESDAPTDQSADNYFTLGAMYAAEGELEQAVEAYSRALQLNPHDSEAWLNRARVQLSLGQYSRAVDDCSESLEYDPHGLTALWCRAQSYVWLRRYAEALNDLNQALRIEKRSPEVHFLRGLAHLGLGKNREAIADLNKARRFAPTWAEIYLARSRSYQALGKTKYAEADLAEAIRRQPRFADSKEREACLAGRPLVDQ